MRRPLVMVSKTSRYRDVEGHYPMSLIIYYMGIEAFQNKIQRTQEKVLRFNSAFRKFLANSSKYSLFENESTLAQFLNKQIQLYTLFKDES